MKGQIHFNSVALSKRTAALLAQAAQACTYAGVHRADYDLWFASKRTCVVEERFLYNKGFLLGSGRHGIVVAGYDLLKNTPIAIKFFNERCPISYVEAEVAFNALGEGIHCMIKSTDSDGCVTHQQIMVMPLMEYNIYEATGIDACAVIEATREYVSTHPLPPNHYYNLHPRNILVDLHGKFHFSCFGLIDESKHSFGSTTVISKFTPIDIQYLDQPDARCMAIYSIGLLAHHFQIEGYEACLERNPLLRILAINF